MPFDPTSSDEHLGFRLGAEEIRFIQDLRGRLAFYATLVEAIPLYLRLDWDVVLVNAFTGEELAVDFSKPPDVWAEVILNLAFQEGQVVLGVKTGTNLVVAEVAGEDPEGDDPDLWEGSAVAFTAQGHRRYFFSQPAGHCLLPRKSGPIRLFATGAVVELPPSVHPETQQVWEWQEPPWEQRPAPPRAALLRLLTAPATASPSYPPAEDLPAWKDLFPVIVWHTKVLQALLAPAADFQTYYQHILDRALEAGLGDANLLLGLLWHAPLGKWQREPGDLESLRKTVSHHLAGRLNQPGAGPRIKASSVRALTAKLAELQRRLRAQRGALAPVGTHHQTWNPDQPVKIRSHSDLSAYGYSAWLSPDLTLKVCEQADPEFAANPEKMAVVRYYLRNYVSLHPESANLDPARQILAAKRLAGEFFSLNYKMASNP